MKKLSSILAAMVLFAGVSFAQQNPDPAKNVPAKSGKTTKTEKTTKSNKQATGTKGGAKTNKKDAAKPASK